MPRDRTHEDYVRDRSLRLRVVDHCEEPRDLLFVDASFVWNECCSHVEDYQESLADDRVLVNSVRSGVGGSVWEHAEGVRGHVLVVNRSSGVLCKIRFAGVVVAEVVVVPHVHDREILVETSLRFTLEHPEIRYERKRTLEWVFLGGNREKDDSRKEIWHAYV